jgi:hypothetical protein
MITTAAPNRQHRHMRADLRHQLQDHELQLPYYRRSCDYWCPNTSRSVCCRLLRLSLGLSLKLIQN